MEVHEIIKEHIKGSGRTFTWVAQKISELGGPSTFTKKKLSAALNGNRCLFANELLYICRAIGMNPNVLLEEVIT